VRVGEACDPIRVRCQSGAYTIRFVDRALEPCARAERVLIFDRRVYELHRERLELDPSERIYCVEADEAAKSLAALERHVSALMELGVRRGDVLVSVGGGVIQDLTSFIASTLFRGLEWECVPTTLLAQADSCMGGKTSLNVGPFKNLLGSFHPPRSIEIDLGFLETLSARDVDSGIGEILKVHILAGPESFQAIAEQFDVLRTDSQLLLRAIRSALEIKRGYCEADEFDRGGRLVLNYGHTFGHAIEAASDFAIPHGIAVTLGMQLANLISLELGRITRDQWKQMDPLLYANARSAETSPIDLERFWQALKQDKKNTQTSIRCILLDSKLSAEIVSLVPDDALRGICERFLLARNPG